MWSHTIYLKASTKAEFDAALASIDTNPERLAVDQIGDIYTGGEYDEEGTEVVAPVKIDGWHVNIRVKGEVPDALKAFVIEKPTNAVRDFA